MDQIVQNRVQFLEREVVHLRTLVAAHNQTLVEAHRILQLAATMLPSQQQQQSDTQNRGGGVGGGGTADQFRRLAVDLANVQRRIPRVLDAQAKAFQNNNSNNNRKRQQQRDDDDDNQGTEEDDDTDNDDKENFEDDNEEENPLASNVPSPAFFAGGGGSGRGNKKSSSSSSSSKAIFTIASGQDGLAALQRDILRCSNAGFESWCTDTLQSFEEILSRPSSAFDVFREEPSEDALEGFMEAFENARDLLCRTVTPGSDVFVSPFAVENPNSRVAGGLQDILSRAITVQQQQQQPQQEPPRQAAQPQPQPKIQQEVQDGFAGYPNFSRVPAQQQQQRRPVAAAVVPPLSSNSATYSGSAMAAARATNLPSDVSSGAGRGASRDGGDDDYADDDLLLSTADPRSLASTARGSNTAPLTPSRYRPQKNHSDQMAQVMAGTGGGMRTSSSTRVPRSAGGGGTTTTGVRPSATTRNSSVPSSSASTTASHQQQQQQQAVSPGGGGRLALLQWQLQQLEMQLFTHTQGGARASGSEAKYYAINKKLQRIRAEIIKEQRSEQEVQQVQHDVAEQRKMREHDRLQFGR